MDFAAGKRVASLALAFALLALLAIPSHALTQVEGRISRNAKGEGYYDLILQVWSNPAAGMSKLLQTIQIPRVDVVNGAFKVAVETDLASPRESGFSIKIESRPFETWEPFRPAEVSRCTPM